MDICVRGCSASVLTNGCSKARGLERAGLTASASPHGRFFRSEGFHTCESSKRRNLTFAAVRAINRGREGDSVWQWSKANILELRPHRFTGMELQGQDAVLQA